LNTPIIVNVKLDVFFININDDNPRNIENDDDIIIINIINNINIIFELIYE
jgi:hypothetical protein